jgi:Na+/H+-dicarboxylate symporter
MAKRLFQFILVAMALGVAAGVAIHYGMSKEAADELSANLKILTDLFLRLIKMIIAPLVFSTLVAGIAHMGAQTSMGRLGVRTLLWFLFASALSLTLGLVMVNLLQPGVGANLTLPASGTEIPVKPGAIDFREFIRTHIIPTSIFDAMAQNQILQIVVFSIFAGVALAAVGEKAKGLVALCDQLVEVMLKITGYVMMFAPIAVFAAVAVAIARNGPEVLLTYAKFLGGFYLALIALWCLLLALGFIFLGPRVFKLVGLIREPLLLAFSTASSEAAYPKTLESLERFGVPKPISGFVLPLGYSFNLDGSMMYCTFAVMFIAQIVGAEISIAQQITMLLILMITSKGMAGVPRASLVVIAATLIQFNLPIEGVALIFAIDQFLDMGRSATNVVGNAVATAVVAKWEGALQPEKAAAISSKKS